jgi:CHASE3 domain sensor protein
MIGDGDEDEVRFDWRRGGAAAAGFIAALILVGMVFLVKFANDQRERALTAERRSYEVALVVRNVSANISGAEAALARFVLDEHADPNGNIYAADWQLAGYQIQQLRDLMKSSPAQLQRVAVVERLYDQRGQEFALAARAALENKGDAGISYFYAASTKDTGKDLDKALNEVINAERQSLRGRIAQSQFVSDQADQFTSYLSWLGILVGLGAVFLAVVSVAALRQNALARKHAESESDRAESLEQAVRERTQ